MLEEAAVNATEVPMEMIQMRNSVDYASQLTMSSSKFLRKVYNRQSKFQKNITRIVNNIYNNEFDDNITLSVVLPPPMFLNITNTNQMMTNVNEYSQSVAQLILDPDEEEPIKNEVIREINKFNLGSYLNIPELEEIAHKAKQRMAAENNEENGEE
jgi:cell division protein FtsX